MSGPVPESIGQLVLLKELYLGWDSTGTNTFVGPLPSSMSALVLMETLYLNVATLNGPMPDFSKLTALSDCDFLPSQLCRISQFLPENSACSVEFEELPVCETVSDCDILANWLPNMFDSYFCCEVDGVSCEDNRIVILDISTGTTGVQIDGEIPVTIKALEKLEELYLQGNLLKGNIPVSLATITSLKTLDISNNQMSGVIQFVPAFILIGVESNSDLSLDATAETPTVDPKKNISNIPNDESSGNLPMIVGVCAGVIALILIITIVAIFVKRRLKRKGKDFDMALGLLPSYSCENKQIRLLTKINSGGFGVVWKARYETNY
jgi:Leucine-rich repeat (LRR) protein